MSPTPIGRSRGHRQVGVGDSDLEAVEARHAQEWLVSFFHEYFSALPDYYWTKLLRIIANYCLSTKVACDRYITGM
ncbi:MAG: hypothetical protein K2H04_03080, partial [Bacteroidaceae bacterium]|nr:hypothetical protein [Bacteroidaceae bacterium]